MTAPAGDGRTLAAFLAFVTALSAAFIGGALVLGERGNYLAGLYMFGPAIAAILARTLVQRPRFAGSGLRIGRPRAYPAFWLFGLGVVAANVAAIQIAGAIRWDLSGQSALAQLERLAAQTGQPMTEPPAGMTAQTMLILFTIGGLTVFNILPGLLIGLGEELGWRGLMFPGLYRIGPWVAIVIGGLIWYAWHLPLLLVVPGGGTPPPSDPPLVAARTIALVLGGIATHTIFAYAYARSGSIWVASLLHGTIDNASRAFSYWVVVVDQFAADVALALSMVVLVAALAWRGELRHLAAFFSRTREP